MSTSVQFLRTARRPRCSTNGRMLRISDFKVHIMRLQITDSEITILTRLSGSRAVGRGDFRSMSRPAGCPSGQELADVGEMAGDGGRRGHGRAREVGPPAGPLPRCHRPTGHIAGSGTRKGSRWEAVHEDRSVPARRDIFTQCPNAAWVSRHNCPASGGWRSSPLRSSGQSSARAEWDRGGPPHRKPNATRRGASTIARDQLTVTVGRLVPGRTEVARGRASRQQGFEQHSGCRKPPSPSHEALGRAGATRIVLTASSERLPFRPWRHQCRSCQTIADCDRGESTIDHRVEGPTKLWETCHIGQCEESGWRIFRSDHGTGAMNPHQGTNSTRKVNSGACRFSRSTCRG